MPLWVLRDDGFFDEERRRVDAPGRQVRQAAELHLLARVLGEGRNYRQLP